MTSIQLTLTGAQASAQVDGPLTAGMVGIPVTIQYDDSWEGLTKTLVCKNGPRTQRRYNVGTQTIVAPEVMFTQEHEANILYLGVEGRDAEGKLVLPSTYAYCGAIQPGAQGDCPEAAEESAPIWAQILAQLGDLGELNTEEKSSLVAAINSGLEDGDEIESIAAEYQRGDNNETAPTGTWMQTYPAGQEGGYLWVRLRVGMVSGKERATCFVCGTSGQADTSASDVQKDYVDKNDQAAREYARELMLGAHPVNLLDNSYLLKPVNQRHKKSSTPLAYCYDRWMLQGASSEVYLTGLKVTFKQGLNTIKRFCQRSRETLEYGDYTLAIRAKVETLSGSVSLRVIDYLEERDTLSLTPLKFTETTEDFETFLLPVHMYERLFNWAVDLRCEDGEEDYATFRIQWIAMYPGKYTLDTLPEYQRKGDAMEELACLRYYYETDGGKLLCGGYIREDTTTLVLSVPLPLPMRDRYNKVTPGLIGTPTVTEVRTCDGTCLDIAVDSASIDTNYTTGDSSAVTIACVTQTFAERNIAGNIPVMAYVSDLAISAEP